MQGLSSAEVQIRINQGATNRVPKFTTRTIPAILKSNIINVFNGILVIAILALLFIHSNVDALFVGSVTFFNTLAGIVEEIRAKIALERIALLQKKTTRVIRDGVEQIIQSDEVVQDDLVIVSRGDQIVADGQLITNDPISIDEALLTGESNAQDKKNGDFLLSGSFCVSGTGVYQALKVGLNSHINTLAQQVKSYKISKTPLQKDISRIVEGLTIGLFIFIAILVVFNWHKNISFAHSVLAIVTVIKAFVPQGLILFTTLAFAFGAIRVARKHVLVQKLNALEAMSNVNVLCLDKTGTLGTNNLLFSHLVILDYFDTTIKHKIRQFVGAFVDKNSSLLAIAKAFTPTTSEVVKLLPFSSATKVSAVQLHEHEKVFTLWLGAPEMLAASQLSSEETAILHKLRNAGFRVLLLAQTEEHLPQRKNLTHLAFIVLKDELRSNVISAIKFFEARNIHLKILSGDHPETIAAIAKQIGMKVEGISVNGKDLIALSDIEFARTIKTAQFFGNLLPQQKQKIIKSLQKDGVNVGMIGDGVNDVLALKQADIGVAMYSGSPASRDVADIVLLQDSFTHLPVLAQEGDRIIYNVKRVAKLFITKNIYCFFYIAFLLFLGINFPLSPRYITWIDALTLGMPIALVMLMVPELPKQTVKHFFRDTLKFALIVGGIIAVFATAAYLYFSLFTYNSELLSKTAGACVIILMNLYLVYVVTSAERHARYTKTQAKWSVAGIVAAAITANFVIFNSAWLRNLFMVASFDKLAWFLVALIAILGIVVIRTMLQKFNN